MVAEAPITCEHVKDVGDGKVRRFAILVSGNANEYVTTVYAGLAGLYERLLGDSGEAWQAFRVIDGHFPSDNEVHDYEGFVITGSRYDAHSNEPWVLQLCSFIRKLHSQKVRLLGICFGHQVICRALGGRTGRSEHGWEVGLRKVRVWGSFYNRTYAQPDFPSTPIILEIHQDEVYELPPKAELLASTEKIRNFMYAIEDHILCIQGHPEFTEDIAMVIFDICSKTNVIPEDILNGAKLSFAECKADHRAFQQLCQSFLKNKRHPGCHNIGFNNKDLFYENQDLL